MNDQIKFSIVTTFQVILMCLSASFIFIVIDITLENPYSYIFAINPFTSGLIHSNFDHLIWNIFSIFICLNIKCNRFYTFEKIFRITSLIAILYLPIILIDYEFAAIGISGTCYFLLIRGLISIKKLRYLTYFIAASIIISEFIELGDNDRIAHAVHLIGSILGLMSLYPGRLKIVHEKIYEIIS